MSTKIFIFGQAVNHQTSVSEIPRDYICDTYAERPTSGLLPGSRLFALDNGKVYRATSATVWTETGGGAAGEAFPVGSVFIAVVATNPGTLLGYGTWSAFAAGRVLVGLDSGQTEFDTVEETGGAKTHTLTSAEMPSHTHVQDSHNHTQNAHTHTQDAHSHVITSQTATTGGATSYEHGTLDTSSAEAEATETTATAVAVNQNTTATNQAATATNQSTGGGGAHNNLQPYTVVYMWKRTA